MNRLRAIVFCCFVGCAILCTAQDSHLAQGAAYFRQGNFDAALTEFRAAQLERPQDASIMNLIGITDTKLGHIDEANEEYKKAISIDSSMLAPRKNLAVNYLASAHYAEAEAQLKEAIRIDSSDPFVHAYLASLYIATSRDEETIKQYEPAAALISSDPSLLYGTALAFLHLHQGKKALPLIAIGEEKSFFTVEQEYQMALQFAAQKDFANATDRFQKIVNMEPTSWSAKEDLAISLLNDNRQEQAIPLLEELVNLRPTDANVQALLGSAYELSRNGQKALDAYRQALAQDPDNPDRYLDYARLLMDLDRYSDASEVIQSGISRSYDPYALSIRQGSIQMLQRNYAAAKATFRKAIEQHPEIGLGYYALAQCEMKDGRSADAEQILNEGLTKVPNDAKLEYLNGLVLSQLGKNDQATAAFKKSIALDNHAAEPHYELGKLFANSGQLESAKAEFQQAIAITPGNANAFYQLSKIYMRLGDRDSSAKMARQTENLLAQSRSDALRQQKSLLSSIKSVSPQ